MPGFLNNVTNHKSSSKYESVLIPFQKFQVSLLCNERKLKKHLKIVYFLVFKKCFNLCSYHFAIQQEI